MSEKDFNDVAEDMTDNSANEYEDLSDFVDLEDLSDLMNEEDFADLKDLGDISDLNLDESDFGDDSQESEMKQVLPEPLDNETDIQTDAAAVEEEADAPQELDLDTIADLPDLDDIAALQELDAKDSLAVESEPAVAENDQPETGETDEALDDIVGGFLDDLDAAGSGKDGNTEEVSASPEKDIPVEAPEIAKDSIEDLPVIEEGEPEEEIFGLDDILALEQENPSDDPVEDGEDIQALLNTIPADLPEDLADASSKQGQKKAGIMKRLFGNVVTDEIAQAELAQREKDKEEEAARQEAAEAAKAEKDAAKAAKAEEKQLKKAAKAEEKELKKAAKAEEKAQKKEEKEAKRAEEKAQAELEVTGRLNKVGVSIVVILTVMFLTAEISGTNVFSYQSTMKEAKGFFDSGRYTDAYREILGTNVKKKDQETYEKIITVMKVQRSLNSYENYTNMKYYPDALNALLVGLRKYNENIEDARNLEVDKDLDKCREQILSLLDEEYGVSEKEADGLLSLKKDAYTDKVVKISMQQK